MLRLVSQRWGWFLFFHVSLCHSSFYVLFLNPSFMIFSAGEKWPPLLQNSVFTLLCESYYYFFIVYCENTAGIFLYKRTSSSPRWPLFLSNTRLPCYMMSCGWRRWISMKWIWMKTIQEWSFGLAFSFNTSCSTEQRTWVKIRFHFLTVCGEGQKNEMMAKTHLGSVLRLAGQVELVSAEADYLHL